MAPINNNYNLLHSWTFKNENILSSIVLDNVMILGTSKTSKLIVLDINNNYRIISELNILFSDEQHKPEYDSFVSVLCLEQFNNEYLFVGTSDSLVRIYKINTEKNFSLDLIATIYSTIDVGDILSLCYLALSDTLIFGTQRCCLLYVNNVLQGNNKSTFNFMPAELDDDTASQDIVFDISDSESIISHLDHLPSNRFDKFFDSVGPTGKKSGPSLSAIASIPTKNSNFHIIQVPGTNIVSYAHNGFIYCLNSYLESNSSNCEYLISSSGDGMTKKWIINQETYQLELIGIIDTSSNLEEDLNKENESILSQFIKFPLMYQGLNNNKVQVISLLTDKLVETIDLGSFSNYNGQIIYDIFASSEDDSFIFICNNDNVFYFNVKDPDNYGFSQKPNLFLKNQSHGKILSMNINKNKLSIVENDGKVSLFTLWDILCKRDEHNLQGISNLKSNGSFKQATLSSNELMIKDLSKLIAFKTTSENVQELHSCASYLESLLTKMNSEVEIIPNVINGVPILKSVFKANRFVFEKNPKTILIYAHYDVVPSGIENFKLLVQDGFLKGRGVSDNKGPIISMMHAINDLQSEGNLTNNVIFLFEGCEEIGSIGFEATLNKIKNDDDEIDYIIMANSYWIGDQLPCLNYGMRGVINMKVSVTGSKAFHSGTDGGISFETTKDLIFCINDLINSKDGSLNVPGFFNEQENLISDEERKLFEDIVATKEGNATLNTLITKWTKPSVSITCLEGSSGITIIPKEASVTLSIRTVPNQKTLQEIKDLISNHIQKCFYKLGSDNQLKVEILNKAEPWLGDFNNRIYKIAMEELRKVWNTKDVLLIREGGSIPTIKILERLYPKAQLMILPNGQASDNAHLPGEKFRLENFFNLKKVVKNIVQKI